jgi:hypothetical protein
VGQITISRSSNNIVISNNTFDIRSRDIGFPIFILVKFGHEIHDIKISNNTFIGDGDAAIAALLQGSSGRYHDIDIIENEGIGIYDFFHSWGGPWIDPDGDGNTSDDYAPYGFDIARNTVEIADGGHDFVVLHGVHEVDGMDSNYIRDNRITTTGTQTTRTNLLQIHWSKDLIIEGNVIEGPSSTGICDGTAMMIDWAYLPVRDRYISDGIVIRNNVITGSTCVRQTDGGPGYGGISIFKARNVDIYNNVVVDSDYGIRISGHNYEGYECDNIMIRNNTVRDSKEDGILVERYVTNVTCLNNIVLSSGDDGIDDNSGNVGNDDENYNSIYSSGDKDCEGSFGNRVDNTCGADTITQRTPGRVP